MRNAFRSGVNKLCANRRKAFKERIWRRFRQAKLSIQDQLTKLLKILLLLLSFLNLWIQANPLSSLHKREGFLLLAQEELKRRGLATRFVISTTPTLEESVLSKHQKAKALVLSGTLASYAKINDYGFLETPYRKVDKETGIVSKESEYKMADIEDTVTLLNHLNHCQKTEGS